MCVINDPLSQAHSPFSYHYSHLKFVLFCKILKSGNRRTDGRTDVQTPHVKRVFTTNSDCATATWINKERKSLVDLCKCASEKRKDSINLYLSSCIYKEAQLKTRQVSSMIHSARPTVVNIVFVLNFFCFDRF